MRRGQPLLGRACVLGRNHDEGRADCGSRRAQGRIARDALAGPRSASGGLLHPGTTRGPVGTLRRSTPEAAVHRYVTQRSFRRNGASVESFRMTTQAIRITLLNAPGALAAAAQALAELDVNIVDVDVHELDGDRVVDEVIVWMPDDLAPGELRRALLDAGCIGVETVPHAHHTTDAIVRCLDGLARCIPETPRHAEALLEMAAQMMPGATARVVPRHESSDANEAVERGIPVSRPKGANPVNWTVAVPYPEDCPAFAIELCRVRMRPSATEIARVRALLRIYRLIAGRQALLLANG